MAALYSETSGGHMSKRPRMDMNYPEIGGGGSDPRQMLSQEYVDQQLNKRSSEPEKPNHILLLTVLNPLYPITCETLHTICNPIATVLRIVIFKKNGVQAMVEFENVDAAGSAKEALHGCDIYCGCCTLKVEYAKPTRLNVYKNDRDSWDYTKLEQQQETPRTPQTSHRPVLLKDPPKSYNNSRINNGSAGFENGYNSSPPPAPPPPPTAQSSHRMGGVDMGPMFMRGVNSSILGVNSPGPQNGGAGGSYQGSPVCMVYGLCPETMNADRLFNIFCLYGNVMRIKFLKTKEGCAMVQMGDGLAVERVVTNLNNSVFMGCKMQLGFSKQAFLADVQSPYSLPDATPSYKDFMGSKNNRFINPEMASKNRIQPPSRMVHFFNTPPGLRSEEVEKILEENGASKPNSIKMFPPKTDRSSSGLLEFESISHALEALVFCNHLPVANPSGKFPYIMKLCFSSSRSSHNTIS